jgi:hypothetical protein
VWGERRDARRLPRSKLERSTSRRVRRVGLDRSGLFNPQKTIGASTNGPRVDSVNAAKNLTAGFSGK